MPKGRSPRSPSTRAKRFRTALWHGRRPITTDLLNAVRLDVRRQAIRNFSSFYLTLISIIQSLALTSLLADVGHPAQPFAEPFSVAAWTQALTIGLLIVYVWHEYVVGLVTLRWVISIVDSMIPMCFGATEFLMIKSLNSSGWFLWTGVFLGIGVLAYLNMYWRASEEGRNRDVLEAQGRYKVASLIIIASLAVVALGVWTRTPPRSAAAHRWVSVVILFGGVVLFGIVRWRLWRGLVTYDRPATKTTPE